jgi:hypothetical protein
MPRRDGPLTWPLVLLPAVACEALLVYRLGPGRGYGRVAALGLLVSAGVLGITVLLLAFLPGALERAGLPRLAAWFRRHGDGDVR